MASVSSGSSNSFSPTAPGPRNGAALRLFPSVTPEQYEVLKRMARALHRRCPSWTLTRTALVHEALIKLQAWPNLPPVTDNRFMAVATLAMRQLLVDAVRKKLQVKRGFGLSFVTLTTRVGQASMTPVEYLDLDRALDELEQMNARHAQAFVYTAFFGYTIDETAELLKVTPRTVQRDLRASSAWIASRLSGGKDR
jgi:RNA polymerase sigma factor (TIGR02999 family)